MRYGIAVCTIAFAGLMASGSAEAQGRIPSGNHLINRNWPDDGAGQPSPAAPTWDGTDAVGLQFKDSTGTKAGSNTVSVGVLRMSGEARKEMVKSDKALKAGDVRGSAEHLEKMLALAPDLAVGYNVLGTRYVALQEYDRAIESFQKAATLEPKYRVALDNLTVAMCMQHKYPQAEPYARWALQIQPEAPSSKYLLGSILISEDKATDEATRLLRSVEEEYPRARLFLANMMVKQGEIGPAIEEIKGYLSSPKANDNGVAQEWLERLEKQLTGHSTDALQLPQ
ncbi:MAG TPA: tetratricopeptide repeat protein [Dongiaceae bacterium]|nr:tetratricopeptide repeat protein [Dongiaceae bacterium]